MRLLILMALIALASASLFHHHHNKRRTFPRHKVRSPARIHVRSERKAEECQKHEHHLICGPERHCDRTCENLFSPPHCIDHLNHAKCYHPRCVCNAGYVRDDKGICIRPSHCPNTYYEPASMIMEDNNEMMIQFKPVKFSRIGHHKVLRIARKSRPHRPSELAIRI